MRSRHSIYFFAVPALFVLAAFFIYPIALTFQMSFTNFTGVGTADYVGFKNYIRAFTRSRYVDALQVTIIFAITVVTLQTLFGLVFAAMLHRLPAIRNFCRAALFTPAMMSFVIVGYVWQFIYSPFNGGLNALLTAVGLEGLTQNWLGDPVIAVFAVAFVQIWMFTGFTCAIFLAGFANIPADIDEAGRLDGASSWQRFRHLELPLLAPSFTINIILSTIGSLKTFELQLILTNGGPDGATRTLSMEIINNLFEQFKFGFASSLAIIMLVIVLTVAFIQNKVLRDRENVT